MGAINFKIEKLVKRAKNGMIIDRTGNITMNITDSVRLHSIDDIVLHPQGRDLIRSGYAITMPNGYVGHIWPVVYKNKGIARVIDPGFSAETTAELAIAFFNYEQEPIRIPLYSCFARLWFERVE